jgi:hypothetical protein
MWQPYRRKMYLLVLFKEVDFIEAGTGHWSSSWIGGEKRKRRRNFFTRRCSKFDRVFLNSWTAKAEGLTPCNLVVVSVSFGGNTASIFVGVEQAIGRVFDAQNISQLLPDYTGSHSRRQYSSPSLDANLRSFTELYETGTELSHCWSPHGAYLSYKYFKVEL